MVGWLWLPNTSRVRIFRGVCTATIRSRFAAGPPLAMAATVELVHRARAVDKIETALIMEYRFAHRIAAQGDFQEGIRALIIDKDKAPAWSHASLDAPSSAEVSAMLMPLGDAELKLEEGP